MRSVMASYEISFFLQKIYIKSKLSKSMFGHHFFNVYALGNIILQKIGMAVVNAQRDSESNEVSIIS